MARWRKMVEQKEGPVPTKVSRNGQIVLPAKARRAVGIEPGDQVVTIPAGPGLLRVEKVAGSPGQTWSEFLESDENPLRGAFGPDPQAFIDELRGSWQERLDS